MTSIFWSNNPQILFNKKYVLELWPTSNMCYEEKLNAILSFSNNIKCFRIYNY